MSEKLFDMIKTLCEANGTSGDESGLTELIISMLPDDCEKKVDALGNLIVTKKGKAVPKNRVMLAAHQDEVGFIVTYITEQGFLRFAPVGGINPETVIGRQLKFKNGTVGVIGTKAIHQQSKEERSKPVKFDGLLIDIGASSREEAEKYVLPGDCAYFLCGWTEYGDNMIKAKALDDRAGCAVLIDMLNSDLPYDITCVFTVQEEIGTRGAKAAAYSVAPDYAIVLETTTACDFSGNDGEKRVCELGKGCVVSYMDNRTIYSKELYHLAFDKAKEISVPCQTKSVVAGGNDSGAIHTAVGGIKTVALSVPCRYLHSPACVIKRSDAEATAEMCRVMFKELCER